MSKHKPSLAAGVPLHYRVSAPEPHTHLFHVTLLVAEPTIRQEVTLPVWIPGSYLVREFSKHLQCLEASQNGKPCAIRQLDKQRWQIACLPGAPLELRYQVYAHDDSVRTAWLDAARGFFNPTSLCLQVCGQTHVPHLIEVASPNKQWRLATGLSARDTGKRGFGSYLAPDYDTLADSPFEMGDFWSADFNVCGVPHRFVIASPPPAFDGERLIADTRRICEAAMRFWHGERPAKAVPFQRYVFMLRTVDEGYGGLEHLNSTALIAGRKALPRPGETPGDDYITLLGLISHEYFHAWNVKRLRPAELVPYHYGRENYTDLLWFFEGFTSYYDDLLLLRAGCVDVAGYLKQLNKAVDSVQAMPGRAIHSLAQASFEAWTKYYRQDANTPNATVSYYTKGALLGLCLDLTLRQEGRTSLDAVMRALYQRCYAKQKPLRGMSEGDVAAVLQELGGRSFARELREWVHGTDELPLEKLLRRAGVRIVQSPAPLARQWGLRCKEGASISVQGVARGGAAEHAGMAAGDEWLGIELADADVAKGSHAAWRVGNLADVQAYLPPGRKPQERRCTALVARDRMLLRLPLTLPAEAVQQWKLEPAASQRKKAGERQKGWPWA
ncbi:M61 family metallopeptidase [Brachymonas denitrificans]|uniref:Predicted metalloprotease, contains C-terminal PDZ domain n=1 Tax=Brachymonas denitrificans DSM 15123 TaxID=1121117 RepID=A0A1H8JDX8_9BURK|nr:M61 family metallopeptidase [Brachymonas denitrificans]SEN78398.1 Predicted metalloprotease, contains C-terminal PDZ domain [Brachymonas denitrificans DSM 15123]